MRKFIFIVLSVLLLLSLTAMAYAEEPQIKLSGRILVRGWYFNGVDMTGGTINNVPVLGDGTVTIPFSASYLPVQNGHQTINGLDTEFNSEAASLYTTNAYLTVDAKISDNLQAYMELETADNRSGTSGLYKWGDQGSNDAKPVADLFFRQLWIQYTGSGLLGAPAGIKIGHQLLSLGEKQFLVHERFGDDAIVLFVSPTKELFLAGIIDKLYEGKWQDNTDDIDAYILLGTYKLDKDNTVGINYTYVNDSNLDLAFQNLGFHANGLIAGALTYAAEFDTQFGHVFENDRLKFKGWDFMAKAGYKLDPINLRASFAMGSGDNEANDDKISEFQFTGGTNAVSPLARYVHYTQIYERTVATSAGEQLLGYPNISAINRNSGTANTTYYNLGVDLMATKDLNLSLDGFILRATKSWPDANGSKSIGSELDFKGSYKLAKNLTYFVEAAGFWPGDFYKSTFGIEDSSVTQVVHGINLTF